MGVGPSGGFGFATRSLGSELVKGGIEITIIMPQPRGCADTDLSIDGIKVKLYPRLDLRRALDLFKNCDADVFHSQEPSLGTWLAQRAQPKKKHIVTCRDTRLMKDWMHEIRHPTISYMQVALTALYYENPFVRRAVTKSHSVLVPAHFLGERVQSKYALEQAPQFAPTPIRIPAKTRKSDKPTVCFVGRLDRRKKPERLFKLAAAFPEVRFFLAGQAQDPAYSKKLAELFSKLPNVTTVGFLDQFADQRLSNLMSESWILVNTSYREGLPNSFLEAAAHGCAILASVNPDDFTRRFGAHAAHDDFESCLSQLLEDNEWQARGEAGRVYVSERQNATAAAALHKEIYLSTMRNNYDEG